MPFKTLTVRAFVVVLVSEPVMVKMLERCRDEFTFGTGVRQVNIYCLKRRLNRRF